MTSTFVASGHISQLSMYLYYFTDSAILPIRDQICFLLQYIEQLYTILLEFWYIDRKTVEWERTRFSFYATNLAK